MEPAVDRMEAQLKLWSLTIDNLAAKTQIPGATIRFDALMYVDELKALHAIALSKLIELKAGNGRRGASLKAEMKSAWNDLDAAFKNPMPWSLTVKGRARDGSEIPPDPESIGNKGARRQERRPRAIPRGRIQK